MTATTTSLKNWSLAASNFIALIPWSSIYQNKCWHFSLEMNSRELYRSSGKENESRCFVFTSSIKREIRHFHVVVVQWVTAKKWTKKRDARAEMLLCQAKPIAFLLSSLTSPSSLLKFPVIALVTSVADSESLVHVYPAPLIVRILCTRITWGRKACTLSFTASTREKSKVCNSYATWAKYFKARVITFTFKVKRIINTLLIY